MRLVRFKALGLNHIDSIELTFDNNLTFITGVNGSGKTSVLHAIISLLSPNFETLGALSYKNIAITFQAEGKEKTISAKKDADGNVTLGCSGINQTLTFAVYEDDVYSADDGDNRRRYYVGLASSNIENRVLDVIANTPTPMFLGLDRRHSGGVGLRGAMPRSFARRRKRNIFSSSLGDSLRQAATLAEDRYSQFRSAAARYSSEFVRDLLLSLLEIPAHDVFAIEPPTANDRKLIEDARKAITRFPRVEGISADAIRATLDPTLRNIREIVSSIPDNFDFHASNMKKKRDLEAFNATLKWMGLKPTLAQITKIATLITGYNERLSKSSNDIEKYTKLIDDFLGQTGKGLGFDESGRIEVRSSSAQFGVEDLSSGEAQLFVLLTHLSFNPYAAQAGVVVIDEPELSLHLIWQEMLTASMMRANSDLQYIMATHSPSIIGENVGNAVDISRNAIQ